MKRLPLLAMASLSLVFGSAHLAGADPEPIQVKPALSLAQGTWISGTPTTIAAQHGKVTVVLFWTLGCINCRHNLGYWNDWAKRYKGTDVTILSVHTPETPGERSVPSVRRFAQERGLLFPILIDNSEKTWNAFGIQSWPTEVLIDKQGRVRYQYAGELNWQGSGEYKTVQARIEQLRQEQVASR